MSVNADKVALVDRRARYLLSFQPRYGAVGVTSGVNPAVIMCIAEREMSGSMTRNLAQGDPLTNYSVNVPAGEPRVGHPPPFTWEEAAVRALQIDKLNLVKDWTITTALFEMELYNGFGYRDVHGMRSPYLWGATNNQQLGKYTSDGRFDATTMDPQLGVAPLLRRIMELQPAFKMQLGYDAVAPSPISVGGGGDQPPPTAHDTWWVQRALNALPVDAGGADPKIDVDGSYGRRTRYAAGEFQEKHHLRIDGLAGTVETIPSIEHELAAHNLTVADGPPLS